MWTCTRLLCPCNCLGLACILALIDTAPTICCDLARTQVIDTACLLASSYIRSLPLPPHVRAAIKQQQQQQAGDASDDDDDDDDDMAPPPLGAGEAQLMLNGLRLVEMVSDESVLRDRAMDALAAPLAQCLATERKEFESRWAWLLWQCEAASYIWCRECVQPLLGQLWKQCACHKGPELTPYLTHPVHFCLHLLQLVWWRCFCLASYE